MNITISNSKLYYYGRGLRFRSYSGKSDVRITNTSLLQGAGKITGIIKLIDIEEMNVIIENCQFVNA